MFLHSSQVAQPCSHPLYFSFFVWICLGPLSSSILSSWDFYLTSHSLGWESLELEGAKLWISTSILGPLFPSGPYLISLFWSFWGMRLLFTVLTTPRILNPTISWSSQQRLPDLHIPDKSILVSDYEEQQTTSPCVTQKRLSWMWSWVTCVLLYCPSTRYWGV